jgi:uncharacterized protein
VQFPDTHPVFGPFATVVAAVLFGYALLVEPLWGRHVYRGLERRREDDPAALVRVYRLAVGTQWTWTALVLAAVAVAPGLRARDIGVRLPRMDPFAYGLAGALVVVTLVTTVAWRSAVRRGTPIPGQENIAAMLPRTTAERGHAAVAAVTAGVCEELLFRGFFIAAGIGVLRLPAAVAVVVSVVVFALAHLYQGWRGMIGVTAITVVFTVLYVRSGSLLLPVVLHVVTDLRGLLLVPDGARSSAGK